MDRMVEYADSWKSGFAYHRAGSGITDLNAMRWLSEADALYRKAVLDEEARAFGRDLFAAIASGQIAARTATQRFKAAVRTGIPAERIAKGFWSAYFREMLQGPSNSEITEIQSSDVAEKRPL